MIPFENSTRRTNETILFLIFLSLNLPEVEKTQKYRFPILFRWNENNITMLKSIVHFLPYGKFEAHSIIKKHTGGCKDFGAYTKRTDPLLQVFILFAFAPGPFTATSLELVY